jgi:DNA repair protein RadD
MGQHVWYGAMTLRPYQQDAANAALAWMVKSTASFVIDAATGAGKSHIIAEIARVIHAKTGKRVLCLAPSAELVTQNREKFLATGNRASMFSASAGAKELRFPVVFGSPLTVKNKISRFQKEGADGYALVILDEAHGITPTVRDIIEAMREANPNLRVCGLTATPYRLGSGWIFREHADGRINGETETHDPYFSKCVYKIDARALIDMGFLTRPVIGEIHASGYDTAGLTLNSRGQFDADAVDRAYHGQGRKTAAIVADVVTQARDRRGVMFFAATVQHAREILESLPPELSEIVTGETPKAKRESILNRFKAQQIKYLVNVSVLTTGFDATHVDVVAILRKTESVGLLQQIIGRGLRLHPGKDDCLVLDYTTNIEHHCPDGDLFAPEIKAHAPSEGGNGCDAECKTCGNVNQFAWRKEYIGKDGKPTVGVDQYGYVMDADGYPVRVQVGWDQERDAPILADTPAHYGRRCQHYLQGPRRGEYEQCGYRWTFKPCPHCEAENDIAARYCCQCKGEIVNPNDKLKSDFVALKKDPTQMQTDEVTHMSCATGVSRSGNRTLRVEWVTPYRQFTTWLMPEAAHTRGQAEWMAFDAATNGGSSNPRTITYRKNAETGFYEIKAYNREADVNPREMEMKYAAQ